MKLMPRSLDRLVARICSTSGVDLPELPIGIEVVQRTSPDREWTLILNHTDEKPESNFAGRDLLTGADGTTVEVPAGGVAVVARNRE